MWIWGCFGWLVYFDICWDELGFDGWFELILCLLGFSWHFGVWIWTCGFVGCRFTGGISLDSLVVDLGLLDCCGVGII